MLAALRVILPDVLHDATDVVGALRAAFSTEVSHTQQRLAVLQERKRFLGEKCLGASAVYVPDWLETESKELDATEVRLRETLNSLQREYKLGLDAAYEMRSLRMEAFDALESGPQARVWRALLSEVRFGVSGRTYGMKVWVESWTLAARARACTPDTADTPRNASAAHASQDSMGPRD